MIWLFCDYQGLINTVDAVKLINILKNTAAAALLLNQRKTSVTKNVVNYFLLIN